MNADQIIEKYKLDSSLFPPGIKQHLRYSLNTNGAIILDEVGLLLPIDDMLLVHACVDAFSPMILAAPNEQLYAMKDAEPGDMLPFTHLIPWYESNIWLVLFMCPAGK